jgi:V8-like Glu-specific endopeptidase
MKNLSSIFLRSLLTSVITSVAITGTAIAGSAQIKVIYGPDNRVDPIDSQNSMYVALAKSTAAMIAHHKIQDLNNEQVEISGKTLEQTGVCSTERFASQPAAANCSGFLVSENQLVTAGHCMQTESDCSGSAWVFDFKVEHEQDSQVVTEKSNVYKCKKIVSQVLDSVSENDYAVIELERVVEDREPLKLRSEGAPQVGDSLVVIGHPSGLPTKISDGASVRSVSEVYLKANLDTYGGNSGSAVFNASTGIVEGILVRGETDYIWSGGCRISNQLTNSGGDGEAVTLIKMVEGIVVPETETPEVPEESEEEDDTTVDSGPTDEVIESFMARFLRWLYST